MKTWHWIAIGGVVLFGGYMFLRYYSGEGGFGGTSTVAGKVGTDAGAGAPPLPNLTFSNPTTGKLFTFPSSGAIKLPFGPTIRKVM